MLSQHCCQHKVPTAFLAQHAYRHTHAGCLWWQEADMLARCVRWKRCTNIAQHSCGRRRLAAAAALVEETDKLFMIQHHAFVVITLMLWKIAQTLDACARGQDDIYSTTETDCWQAAQRSGAKQKKINKYGRPTRWCIAEFRVEINGSRWWNIDALPVWCHCPLWHLASCGLALHFSQLYGASWCGYSILSLIYHSQIRIKLRFILILHASSKTHHINAMVILMAMRVKNDKPNLIDIATSTPKIWIIILNLKNTIWPIANDLIK